MKRFVSTLAAAALSLCVAFQAAAAPPAPASFSQPDAAVHYRTLTVDGVEIFYREAGPADAPVLLLLHGFPTSSHMFRDLIPRLAHRYRVIAPDYPGYGFSEQPPADEFEYTFDNIARLIEGFTQAKGLHRYALYLQDFGGPIGLRLAAAHPERVSALIIQNANAYEEGLSEILNEARPAWKQRTPQSEEAFRHLLTPEVTKDQFTTGARDPSLVSPDAWVHAQRGLDRPGNDLVQLAMLHDYGSNVARYAAWQEYFRIHQPPTLIAWGEEDPFFLPAGARAYARDLPDAEIHLLKAGHFALEDSAPEIAQLMLQFLSRLTP